jgi:branched-chain amino acid transport system ATP-binding protein
MGIVEAAEDTRMNARASETEIAQLEAAADSTVLRIRGLKMAFGGLVIFRDLDFALNRGERHAIIGPNGAGKSTFVNLVTGMLKPLAGEIRVDGRDLTHSSPQQRVKAGLVRTFQINTLFPKLTPLESVVLALAQRDGLAGLSWRPVHRCTAQIDEAGALLERFRLMAAARAPTHSLAYGQQRLLEVVMAVALRPRILLLDEPAAGLSTAQGVALFEQLSRVAKGTTVLFIEHDMHLVFRFADRVSVFAAGSVIAQGTPDEVRANFEVRKAYLGH